MFNSLSNYHDAKVFSDLFRNIKECCGRCFMDNSVLGSDIYPNVIRPVLKEFNRDSDYPVKLMVHASDVYRNIRSAVSGDSGENGSDCSSFTDAKILQIMEDIGAGGCLFTFGEMGDCRNRRTAYLDRIFRDSFNRPVFVITNSRTLASDLKLISSFESCRTKGITVIPLFGDTGSSADISRYKLPSHDKSILQNVSDRDTLALVDTNFFVHEKFYENVYSVIDSRNNDSRDNITVTLHQSNILELVKVGYEKPDLADSVDMVLHTINRDLRYHRNFKYGEGMATSFLDSDILSTILLNMKDKNIVVFTQDGRLVNDIIRLNHIKSVRALSPVIAIGFDRFSDELGSLNYRDYSGFNYGRACCYPTAEPGTSSPEAAA